MAFLGQEDQIRDFQNRFKYLYSALFLGFAFLLLRLVYLQILRGDQMRRYSEENRIKRVKISAPRGMIFDRNRTLLIDNRPDFDLEGIPQYLRESKREVQVLGQISKVLGIADSQIRELMERARTQPAFLPVKLKTDLSRDEVAQIEMRKIDMPGIEVKQEIKRTNIFGDIAAHLLGYIGEVNLTELPIVNARGTNRYRLGDSIGRFGLEQRLEDYLRGQDGEEIREVDALGRIKLDQKKSRVIKAHIGKSAIPGKNVILTIDQELQQVASGAFGEKIGSLVAVDPNNGQILAMISRPSFDPTSFSRGIPTLIWNRLISNENHPLRDKTIQDHYQPGSAFKVITAITALEEGVIDEHTHIHCPGVIKIGNRQYHCHSRHGHGDISVVRAITQSCDVFFYRVALRLKSVDDLAKWAWAFGLGKKTGIDLAGEVPGLIPTEEWKRKRLRQAWNPGETAAVAIGQSFVLTTVLQLANLYAALGMGGERYRPYVVDRIESSDGQILKHFSPERVGEVKISPKTLALVKEGLWGVVNTSHGTAYSQRLPGMDMVGKTGTSQVIRISADKIYQKCELMKFRDRHNAVFVAYAPLQHPLISVAVMSEHTCHGGTAAAPIVRAVIKKYLEKYHPQTYGPKALALKLKALGQSVIPEPVRVVEPEDAGYAEVEDDFAEKLETDTPPSPPHQPPVPLRPVETNATPPDGSYN